MEYDVVIVGGGIAGCSAAIKLKQLAIKNNTSVNVAVFEKSAFIGANIVSGCIMDPRAIDSLLPNWKSIFNNIVSVNQEQFTLLTNKKKMSIPIAPMAHNFGNYILSLSQLCLSLGNYAESLGIEIYCSCPVFDYLIEDNQVVGVLVKLEGDTAIIKARQIILAEGSCGYITQKVIEKFQLSASCPQTYALGFKEVWKVPHNLCGKVEHFFGYPLHSKVYGGGFAYHYKDDLLFLGLVTALDYTNTYLNLFEEFQLFKNHPYVKKILGRGECIQFGARCLTEGGIQALPKLVFAGGVIIGDAAGFLNVVKLKGVDNAIYSAMMAADSVFELLCNTCSNEALSYSTFIYNSTVINELKQVRNIRASFKISFYFGVIYSILELYIFRCAFPWTIKWLQSDRECLRSAIRSRKINYTYHNKDKYLYLSNINLLEKKSNFSVISLDKVRSVNKNIYDFPEARYCPADVYSFNNSKLNIKYTNCIHCQACSIKEPANNIIWSPTYNGPNYTLL